jgi:SAM-dependent methyltransferase
VADLPFQLDAALAERLARVFDIEGKLPRALEALGPISDRDVLVVDGLGGTRARQLGALGARVETVGPPPLGAVPDASADVLVAHWSAFRGVDPSEVAEAARILRPGGRLLVVHDYGRDDVSRLFGARPEYDSWSRRDGPFLRDGFRIRVIHCWWTFDSVEEARGFLVEAFGEPGAVVGEGLTRPRLSYNVAVYHRTFGEATSS